MKVGISPPLTIMVTNTNRVMPTPVRQPTVAVESSFSATPRTANPTARATVANCLSWVRNSSIWRVRLSQPAAVSR